MRIDVETGEATVVGYAYTGGQNHGGDIMPSKVTVCHRIGRDGGYVPIEVALDALAKHKAHGDLVPGVDFEGCDCPAPDSARSRDGVAGR